MTNQLFEKQVDDDLYLLHRKLREVEENVQAIRVLIDRVEIAVKHQLTYNSD